MFKTIFRKHFILYFGTMLLSFAIMGAALAFSLQTYFTNQKIELLTKQGARISIIYEKAFTSFLGAINIGQVRNETAYMRDYLGVSCLIVDFVNDALRITSTTTDIGAEVLGTTLKSEEFEEEFQKLLQGEIIVIKGGLDSIYSEPMLTVGYPIMYENSFVSVVLMNSSIPELQRAVFEVLRLTLVCIFFAGCVAFILIYFLVRSVSKPLRQMNEAARVIAGGNFDKRLEVKGRDEVRQLADSFNDMASGLDRQEKMRNEFIANISHDIRSPLTSMRGFLQAIADGTIPPENQSHYINIVLDETERLSKLANDLLDLNKLQALDVKLSKSDFDINEMIRKTLSYFEKRVIDKEISITASFANECDIVYADYEKIQRIIYNLLDNAIKFTPPNGEITVETNINNDKVHVTVRDNGIGITPDDQVKIFDRFFKADISRGQDKKGSGLGLSIVKEFVKAHGEIITLTSEPGKGSAFTFALPRVNL